MDTDEVAFIRGLQARGEIADVGQQLKPGQTHRRQADGSVRRVRFGVVPPRTPAAIAEIAAGKARQEYEKKQK